MGTDPITSPTEGGDVPPAMRVVFPDRVNIRTPFRVETERLLLADGFEGRFDREGEVTRESGCDANVYVSVSDTGTLVSGSLRNWAHERGLVPFDVPFGAPEAGLALDRLGERLGLPSGALRDARLTMVEGTMDLAVSRAAADYVRACEDLARTRPHRWDGTTTFDTAEWQAKQYDRPARLRKQGRPVPGCYREVERSGQRVLRFELTLKAYGVKRQLGHYADEDGEVRAGLLADPEFRTDLARLVIAKARELRFGRVAVPERLGMTGAERRRWEVVRGIEANGGLDAALGQVRAEHEAGHISQTAMKDRLKSYRRLYRDPGLTAPADLEGEFAEAVGAVAETYGL